MKTEYDPETDAMYLRFATDTIIESQEISHNVIFDYDAAGQIVGIEILNAHTILSKNTPFEHMHTA